MAVESPRIRTDIVEATEFPSLVAKYAVRGVPKTILNDRFSFDGAVPEPELLVAVVDASRETAPGDPA